MTPKEKATELADKFFEETMFESEQAASLARSCALVCVDEIMHELRVAGICDAKIYNDWYDVKKELTEQYKKL